MFLFRKFISKWKTSTQLCIPLPLGTIWSHLTLRMLILAFPFLSLIANFCNSNGQIRHEFTCLPFGYSLAPRVFTKVLKPVISYLRANGYKVVIFLDDILLIGSSVEECLSQLSSLRDLLESLGFVINVNKSQLIPVTQFFIWDSLLIRFL